jgi:hypothetical protein
MSTVLLYLSHLSQEGEVREGSLNPYLAAVNQMHQDAGFRRPALGHYVDLLRKDYALRIVEVISRRSALPRAFRRYISRLLRVVVFWLDDPPHSPSTHVIGLPLTWSAICSTSATTVCEPGCRPG